MQRHNSKRKAPPTPSTIRHLPVFYPPNQPSQPCILHLNIYRNCFCLRIYRFYESIFLTRYLIQFLSRPVKIVGVCLPPRPYDFTGFPVSSGNTPRTSGSFPAAGTITRPAAGSGRNPGRQSGHDPDDRKKSTPLPPGRPKIFYTFAGHGRRGALFFKAQTKRYNTGDFLHNCHQDTVKNLHL